MRMPKLALVALGLMLSPMSAAFAQGEGNTMDLQDRQAFFLNPTGKGSMVRINDTGHTVLMQHARELPAGAMIYRSGGKFYFIENKRMDNGAMLFDPAGGWNRG